MSWFNKLFMSCLIWLLHQNKRIFCGVYVINFIPCYVENKALFYNKITTCGLKYKVGVSDKDCHSMKGYPHIPPKSPQFQILEIWAFHTLLLELHNMLYHSPFWEMSTNFLFTCCSEREVGQHLKKREWCWFSNEN